MMRTAWKGFGDGSVDLAAGDPNAPSVLPGVLNSGALDTGNPFTSSLATAAFNFSPAQMTALTFGGVGLALLLLIPSPGGKRR